MIRSLYQRQDGSIRTELEPGEFTTALQDAEGMLWVDFVGETPLRIGMTAETNIIVEQRDNVLLAPATAVREGHVWIVRDGHLHRQPVQPGFSGEARTEIVSGLGDNDILVIRPPTGLTEGRQARTAP